MHLRIAIIVGSLVALLGVVGLFWLPDLRPEPALLRIEGLPTLEAGTVFEAEARWQAEDGSARVEAGRPLPAGSAWTFQATPIDQPVTLVLLERREARLTERLVEQITLPRGRPTTLRLP
jgi:hypothetical protein